MCSKLINGRQVLGTSAPFLALSPFRNTLTNSRAALRSYRCENGPAGNPILGCCSQMPGDALTAEKMQILVTTRQLMFAIL